ncbi:expressed unknown protein [Seminavis robusta]|uniref:Uncharacterized protein n=1 Tax=Seminavis robusta TaxID=568900 RepID=A0A9N8EQT6_9STRA|nr:expressed unknown protein [Seminavis robusta]|eukprot:Sro1459_g274510.1 n/a (767) ;mRNA; r:13639-17174
MHKGLVRMKLLNEPDSTSQMTQNIPLSAKVANVPSHWTRFFPVSSVFGATSNRDTAAALIVGDKGSNGLLCAHDTSPGFCCLDLPGEGEGVDWGVPFNCELGKSKCSRLAPTMAGFNKQTCAMWSGTYCPEPRTCLPLLDCMASEISWGEQKGKKAYADYIRNAPEVKDPTDFKECGAYREYFGFDGEYPKDSEICEDVQFLRNNKDFDDLDAFAATTHESATITPQAETINPQGATAAPFSNAPVSLTAWVPIGSTTQGKNYHADANYRDHVLDQLIATGEQILDVIDCTDCIMEPTFLVTNGCKTFKWIAAVAATLAVFIMGRVHTEIFYQYDQSDCLSNFNMDQMYQRVFVLQDNIAVLQTNMQEFSTAGMDTTNAGFMSIAQQNKENAEKILGDLGTQNADNHKTTQEVIGDQAKTNFENMKEFVTDEVNRIKGDITGHLTQVKKDIIAKTTATCSTGARRGLSVALSELPAPKEEASLLKPELFVPTCLGFQGSKGEFRLAEKRFQSTDAAMEFVRESLEVRMSSSDVYVSWDELDVKLTVKGKTGCSIKFEAVPVYYDGYSGDMVEGESNYITVLVDDQAPRVRCSFDSPNASAEKKTLFVEEGPRKVDTKLSYSVKDNCSTDDYDLSTRIRVLSNELEEGAIARLAKALNKDDVEVAKVYVSPSKCSDEEKDDDLFCVADTVDFRFYDIEVTAKDGVGWSSSDTCRVIVMPNKKHKMTDVDAARELRGKNRGDRLSAAEEDAMVQASSNSFVLGKLEFP